MKRSIGAHLVGHVARRSVWERCGQEQPVFVSNETVHPMRRPFLEATRICCQRTLVTALLLLAFWVAPAAFAQQSHFTGKVVRVEAGDRIVAQLQAWNVTVWLHGVSCPTLPLEAAERARQYMIRRVLGATVTVVVRGTGPHETVFGDVRTADGRSLNDEMIRVGLARWASAYAPGRTDLAAVERDARAANRGIWVDATAANVALPAPATPKPTPRATPHATPRPTPIPTPRPTPRPTPIATPERTPSPSARPIVTPAPVAPSIPSPPPRPLQTPLPSVAPRPAPVRPTPAPRRAVVSLPARAAASPLSPESAFWALLASVFAGATLVFVAILAAPTRFAPRQLPVQLLIAVVSAAGVTLVAPLLYTFLAPGFRVTNTLAAVAILPVLVLASGGAAVRLLRLEQLLRNARNRTPGEISDGGGESEGAPELIKVRGVGAGLFGRAPFVSTVGSLPALYLREVTQIFEAIPDQRVSHSQRRYSWKTIHNETHTADFLLRGDDGATIIVSHEQARFLPLQAAHFYNEVPVDQWFTRPYPGDTRSEITFIAPDAPLVVWGILRRRAEAGSETGRWEVGFDGLRHLFLVAEGDEYRVWSRRPMYGLLLTLLSIGLLLFFAYCLTSPSALDPRG